MPRCSKIPAWGIVRRATNDSGERSMPASQQHVGPDTSMGANLAGAGATFRVWAPNATAVYACGDFGHSNQWAPAENRLLIQDAQGYWSGFVDGVRDGDEY